MVIDFRTRPPYKGFITEGNFFPRPMEDAFENPMDVPAIYLGSANTDIESARVGDFSLYLKELADSKIDLQVVHGRMVSEGMARVNNDDVCQLGQLYPEKFICFPAVDPADCENALKEIQRCYDTYKIKGIALEPGWAKPSMTVNDPSLYPIYDKCAQLGLIVSFTLSALAGEDLRCCHPLDLQLMAKRYPQLTITVSHGCWPYVAEFLAVSMTCPNIYFYPDFFLNTRMPMTDDFIVAINSYMKYRTMFASSYPVRGLSESINRFRQLPLNDDVWDYVLYKNAARILKLDIK